MKVLLVCANTPHINEWNAGFINYVLDMSLPIEVVVYIDSYAAKIKYSSLYPKETLMFYRNNMQIDPKGRIEEMMDWSSLYISWDRRFLLSGRGLCLAESEDILKLSTRKLEQILLMGITHIFYEPPASIVGEVLWTLSKKMGVKYWGIMQSRIPDRIDLYDLKYSNSNFNTFLTIDEEELDKKIASWSVFTEKFIKNEIRPSYLDDECNNLHKIDIFSFYLKRIKYFRQFLKILIKRPAIDDFETKLIKDNLFHSIIGGIFSRKIRSRLFKHFCSSSSKLLSMNKPFYLFPLHYVPEASVSGQAMNYSDLYSTILYTAFNLPANTLLVVKEHPAAVGIRKLSFYKRINKIPNVILLNSNENNKHLIKNSIGVITLTSTLGLEAAVSGKVCYILGEVFFSYHPNCYNISNYKELKKSLNMGNSCIEGLELEKINAQFWDQYLKTTIQGNILNINNREKMFSDLLNITSK